jgi:hypothetical protein
VQNSPWSGSIFKGNNSRFMDKNTIQNFTIVENHRDFYHCKSRFPIQENDTVTVSYMRLCVKRGNTNIVSKKFTKKLYKFLSLAAEVNKSRAAQG